ncbi:MAG: autoinducer synthesis protein [Rhizobium sp.]|nr:autoinducer synthesis protein [Rhizobium sp.]MBW8323099.1 autoinducer synthesis protein [Rhizobium sp.]MBW8445392.1 autoinducer synthesis protein [Arenimonas sp.]
MRVVTIKNLKGEAENRLNHDMHRLRARISRGRLAWKVRCTSGLERGNFDKLGPAYVLRLRRCDAVVGSARLLEKVFPQLLEMAHLSTYHRIIESSRFCGDVNTAVEREQASLRLATLVMFAGIVEWSILNGYREFVTATDGRLERILCRADWLLSRLGATAQINETRSVADLFLADRQSLDRLRPGAYSSDFPIYQTEAA